MLIFRWDVTLSHYGQLVDASGITFGENGKISLDAKTIGDITSATTIHNVFSGGTVTGLTAGELEDNNYVYKFTSEIDGDSIDILIERGANFASLNSGVGAALDKISDGLLGDTNLQNLILVLGAFDEEPLKAVLKTLTPNVSGINTNAVISVADSIIDTIENHIADGVGVSTGDEPVKKGLWGTVFGKDITQDNKNGINGYDADSKGYVIGADGEFGENTLGAALSYADTDASSSGSHTQVDSTQVTVYGKRDFGKLYYESLGLAAINHFNGSRSFFDDSVATSDYDNYLFSAKGGVGYNVNLNQLKVTPFASLQYSYINQPDYTETGSSLGLHVESNNFQSLKSGLGTKLEYYMNNNSLT